MNTQGRVSPDGLPMAAALGAAPSLSVPGVLACPGSAQLSPAPGRQHCSQPHPASLAPSRWSDLVLKAIFSHLRIGDLLACSRVNRLWHQVASQPALQARCVQQTWPCAHRQQMQQALATDSWRRQLTPWCQRSDGRQSAGDTAASAPSVQQLLHTSVQNLLLTQSLYPSSQQHLVQRRGDVQQLLCSPDGCWLVVLLHAAGRPQDACIRLWRTQELDDHDALIAHYPAQPVYKLTFRADSRRLWILYRSGYEEIWQLGADGRWYDRFAIDALCPGRVHKAVFSPDGRFMAAVLRNSLRIYSHQMAQGAVSRCQWRQIWATAEEYFLDRDPAQLVMRFSNDSQHCVFACGKQCLLFTHQAGHWQPLTIALSFPVRGEAVFDAQSRWLALASSPDSGSGEPVGVSLHLWHLTDDKGWQPVHGILAPDAASIPAMVWPRTGYAVPMAFSPDAQLLAIPDEHSCRDVRVLPLQGAERWARSQRLHCGHKMPVSDAVLSQQFASHSQLLAVVTACRALLWQRLAGDLWRPVLCQDNPDPRTAIRLALSPDGYHCALAMGTPGQVAVWGPSTGVEADYVCKLELGEGGWVRCHPSQSARSGGKLLDAVVHPCVRQLQFTPDGLCLLMVSFGPVSPLPVAGTEYRWHSTLHALCLAPRLPVCDTQDRTTPLGAAGRALLPRPCSGISA